MRRVLAKHVKNWKGVRSRFHMAHVGLTKFFDVIEHVVQLFLKNFRLGFSQIYPRQPGNVGDIEIGTPGHDCPSRVQMADQPHDSDRERHQKKEKNDSAFPALLAQRTRSSGCIERMCGFECHRDLKPLVRLVTSCTLFLSACRRFVLRGRPSCNHTLELFEPLTQFGFLSRYLLLLVTKRRGRSARTTKHRHHLLAIQKKMASPTAPKRISGRVSARPICNH